MRSFLKRDSTLLNVRPKKLKGELFTTGLRSLSLWTVVNKRVEDVLFGEGISLGAGLQAFFVLGLSDLIWLSSGFSFGMLPGQVSDFPHS